MCRCHPCACLHMHTHVCSVFHTKAIMSYTRVGGHLPHVQLESRAISVLIVDPVPSDLRGHHNEGERHSVASFPREASKPHTPSPKA